MDAAWELGVRYFDTAPHYGVGLAEQRLGEALAARPREEYVISTKVGRRLVSDRMRADGTEGFFGTPLRRRVWDFSREGVLASLEQSLARLRLERADLVLLHDPEEHWQAALELAYPVLAELRSQGVIAAVGVGSGDVETLERFATRVQLDCVMLAGRCTLLDASATTSLLPLCRRLGIPVICAGVFNSGVLVDPGAASPTYEYAPASAEVVARARAIAAVCARHRVPIGAAAMRFPLRQPAVAAVLVGARHPREIRDDIALARHPIPEELWTELRDEGLVASADGARDG